jgi:hypothetical protein
MWGDPAPTDQIHHNICDVLFIRRLYVTKLQDILYALMHLAIDYEDGGIEVDYDKSSIHVMVEAAAHHVRLHRDLRFCTRSTWYEAVKGNTI